MIFFLVAFLNRGEKGTEALLKATKKFGAAHFVPPKSLFWQDWWHGVLNLEDGSGEK